MKIDCSITENYLKEKRRMCKALGCKDCEIAKEKIHLWCREYCEKYPKNAIALVQKWSDEHPQMTMLEKFKEQHPKGMCSGKGTPIMCPYHLGYEKSKNEECRNYKGNCVKCWNRPYTEDSK